MQQIQVRIDFTNIKPFTDSEEIWSTADWSTISSWAKNPDKAELLKRWVCTYYNSEEQRNYERMIECAILANNLLGLEILWQGIYYHDRDNPDYDENLLVALSAKLETMKHVLYAKLHYAQLDGIPFDPIQLKKEMEEMYSDEEIPEIREYVNNLTICGY